MQVGVNVKRRVDRMDQQKANRLRTVESIPDTAEDGDMILFEKRLFVHSQGNWRNIDEPLMETMRGLTERVTALEGGGDNGAGE